MATTHQHKIELNAQVRTVMGSKVDSLRRSGLVPAVLYGKGQEPIALQVPQKEFHKTFHTAGESTLVYINVDGQAYPTIIHDVARDAASDAIIHADFYKVNLSQKIKTQVPVVFDGEAPAVKENLGVLLQELSELSIEALPTDLPEKIIVDVSNLAAVGDALAVKDLPTPAGVTVLSDPEQFVAHIGALAALEEEVKPVIETPVEVGEAGTQETGAGTEEQSKNQPTE